MEQLRKLIDVPSFDGGAEAIGEHQRRQLPPPACGAAIVDSCLTRLGAALTVADADVDPSLPRRRAAGNGRWKGDDMATLTKDMKRLITEQRLGFYATVSEDGSPNLSPKGTTYVWDDERLFFADVRSPQTVANVRRGSMVEVNVVDPFVRKGYRFKGPAAVHERGTAVCEEGLDRMRQQDRRSSIASGRSCSSR